MTNKVKPCRFCEHEAATRIEHTAKSSIVFVYCLSCPAYASIILPLEAESLVTMAALHDLIKLWNDRKNY